MNIKQSHHAHQTEIFRLIDDTETRVRWHGDDRVLSWEDVGDLVHTEDVLTDLLAFLKEKG